CRRTRPSMTAKLNDLKISTRLTLGFAAMLLLMLLLGGRALVQVRSLEADFARVTDEAYARVRVAGEIKAVNNDVPHALRNLFIVAAPGDIGAMSAVIDGSGKTTNETVARLQKAIADDDGKAALAKLVQARAAYRAPRDRVIALLKAHRLEEAKIGLLVDVRP